MTEFTSLIAKDLASNKNEKPFIARRQENQSQNAMGFTIENHDVLITHYTHTNHILESSL
jgi:hypothetical protein